MSSEASEDLTDVHLRQIFTQLDVNGDGNLNLQELNEGLEHCGMSRRTRSLFQVLDTDKKGIVDWEHFRKVGSGFLSVLQDAEGSDEEDEDEVVDFFASEQQLATPAATTSHQRSRSQAIPKEHKAIPKEHKKSWIMVQHEIAQDVRVRQWKRLQALQAENEELRFAAVKREKEVDKLNEKVREQKEVILAISTEADEHIHDLETKLAEAQEASREASSSSSKSTRGRVRRISCLERLRSKEEEEEENGSSALASDEFERENIPLLNDLRLLTKTNEELHVRVKQRESEYKVLASGLIKHHRRLKSAHERHEKLIFEIDKISEEWHQEDTSKDGKHDGGIKGNGGGKDADLVDGDAPSHSRNVEKFCREFQRAVRSVSASAASLCHSSGGKQQGAAEEQREEQEGTFTRPLAIMVEEEKKQSFPSPSSPIPPTIVIPSGESFATKPVAKGTPYNAKKSTKSPPKDAIKKTSSPKTKTSEVTTTDKKKKKAKKKNKKTGRGKGNGGGGGGTK